jgi:diacylglycerol kinase
MIHFLQLRVRSFQYAFNGIGYVIRTQPNSWIHALATVAVCIVGFWIGLSGVEWALITLSITLVWLAEFINTSIESVIDLTQPNLHPLAKAAKDTAAGAVLLASISSIVVGLLILGPGLIGRLFSR